MTASGTGSLVFMDDVSAERRSSAAKPIRWHFPVHRDNDPKQSAKTTQEFLSSKKLDILQWPSL